MSDPLYQANPQLAFAGGGGTPYESGLLWEYLKNISVYRCPSEKREGPVFLGRDNKMSSYLMSGALVGYNAIPPKTYKNTAFRQDAIIMWQGSDDATASWNDGSNKPDEGFARVHGGQSGTMGGVDGHVEQMKRLIFTGLTLNPAKNPLWCSPGSDNGR